MDAGQQVEKCVRSEVIYRGRIVTLRKDTVVLGGGKVATREVVEHPGAVGIVAVMGEDVILVRQYRYAVNSVLLEIPAGKLEPGEGPADCARRELMEETGLVASNLEYVCSFHTSPGFCDEVLHLFFATGLSQSPSHAQPDPDESLAVVRVKRCEVKAKIRSGEIKDSKTLTALLMLEDILSQSRT